MLGRFFGRIFVGILELITKEIADEIFEKFLVKGIIFPEKSQRHFLRESQLYILYKKSIRILGGNIIGKAYYK